MITFSNRLPQSYRRVNGMIHPWDQYSSIRLIRPCRKHLEKWEKGHGHKEDDVLLPRNFTTTNMDLTCTICQKELEKYRRPQNSSETDARDSQNNFHLREMWRNVQIR